MKLNQVMEIQATHAKRSRHSIGIVTVVVDASVLVATQLNLIGSFTDRKTGLKRASAKPNRSMKGTRRTRNQRESIYNKNIYIEIYLREKERRGGKERKKERKEREKKTSNRSSLMRFADHIGDVPKQTNIQ